MPELTGISGALHLDEDILTDLKTAQESLNAMSSSADKLVTAMKDAKQYFQDVTDGLGKNTNFKITFDDSGALKSIESIADAAGKLNELRTAGSKSVALSEEQLNEKLKRILSARADSYSSVTARLHQLHDWQEKFNAASSKQVNAGGNPFSNDMLEKAKKYEDALRRQLTSLNQAFDFTKADRAVRDSFSLPDATLEQATLKLEKLKIALNELQKPGWGASNDPEKVTIWFNMIDKAIGQTEAKIISLKNIMEQNLQLDAFVNIEDKIDKLLASPAPKSIDDAKDKIKEAKRLLSDMKKEQKGGNIFVDDASIEKAAKALGVFEAALKDLKESAASDKAFGKSNNLMQYALGLDENSIEDIKSKISALKQALKSTEMSLITGDAAGSEDKLTANAEAIKNLISELEEKVKESKTDSAENNILRVLGLDESTVEHAEDKLSQLKSAYKQTMKDIAEGKIKDIPAVVSDASVKIDELRQHIEELRRAEYVEKKNVEFKVFNTEASERGVGSLTEKIRLLQRIVDDIRRESNNDQEILNNANELEGTVKKLITRLDAIKRLTRETIHQAGEFGHALAALGGGFALRNVVRDVVQIRGEFEMAEISLGIILKDTAKATEIFGQIQQTAIKSPFQVRDLVKQTKQLAAYRIETDKLVSTTKMLGDISAGVGVDMNRLILAFGQVKAAGVLKGTELRQFSEAGVNLLGDLAKRFGELNNKMYSTQDIMSMISKKMVSFEDVEAVLQGQTAIGGTFYRMQEQQAETLQGRISNLRDRLDIAFNEMGKNYSSVINLVIDGLTFLIDQWEVLSTMLTAFASYKLITGAFGGIVSGVFKLADGLKVLFAGLAGIKSLFAFDSLLALGPILGGISAILLGIVAIIRAARAREKELNNVVEKGIKNGNELIDTYDRLTREMTDNNKTTKEKEEAFEKLQQSYGNIISLTDANIESLGAETEAYKSNIAAIKLYNMEQTKRELKEKAIARMNSDVNKLGGFLAPKDYSLLLKSGEYIHLSQGEVQSYVRSMIDLALEEEKSFDEMLEIVLRQIADDRKIQFEDIFLSGVEQGPNEKLFSSLKTLIKEGQAYRAQLDNIYNAFDVDFGLNGSSLKKTIDNLGLLKSALEEFSISNENDVPKIMSRLKSQLDLSEKEIASITEWAEELRGITNKYELNELVRDHVMDFIAMFNERLDSENINQGRKEFIRRLVDTQFQNLFGGDIEALTNSIMQTVSQKFSSLDQKVFSPFLRGDDEDMEKWADKLEEGIKNYQLIIEQWTEVQSRGFVNKNGNLVDENSLYSLVGSKEDAQQMKAMLEFWYNEVESYATKNWKESAKRRREAAQQYKQNLRDFISEVKNARKNLGSADDEGDELIIQNIREKAKKVNINVPVNFKNLTDKEFESWVGSLSDRLDVISRNGIILDFNEDKMKENLEKIAREVSNLWDQYAAQIKLRDLMLIDEKKPIETMNKILAYERRLRQINTDESIKAAEEIKNRRLSIVRDEQEQAAKLIYEGLKQNLDKTREAFIDGVKDIHQIMHGLSFGDDALDIDSDLVQKSIHGKLVKTYEDIRKAQYDSFKNSSSYMLAFGNLDELSVNVLESLKKELETIRDAGGLTVSDTKSLAQQILSIERQIAISKNKEKGNIFGSYIEGLRNAVAAKKQLDPKGELFTTFSSTEKRKRDADTNFEDWFTKYDLAIKRMLDLEERKAELEGDLVEASRNSDFAAAGRIQKELNGVNAQLATQAGVVSNAEEKLTDAIIELTDAEEANDDATRNIIQTQNDLQNWLSSNTSNIKELSDAYNASTNVINDWINVVKDALSTFGVEMSEETERAVSAFTNGMSLIGSVVTSLVATMELMNKVVAATGIAMKTALPILAAIGVAIGAVAAAFTMWDNSKVSKIEGLRKSVDELSDSYTKLGDSMGRTLGQEMFNEFYDGSVRNIAKRKEELEDIIATENSRGVKSDEDSVLDAKKAISELDEEMKSLEEKRKEYLNAPTNYQDEAKSWASAWLSAIKEGKSGILSLADSFDDLWDRIIEGQLATRVFGKMMNDVEQMVDDYLADGIITPDEAEAYRRTKEELMARYNGDLEDMLESFGYDRRKNADASLSRGIQSVTETTASAVESIANNIYFDGVQRTDICRQLLSAVQEMRITDNNPMLQELRRQSELISAISETLSSVIAPGHREGGFGLKVFA